MRQLFELRPSGAWRIVGGTSDQTDDDLFLDAVDAIVVDALAIIGDDPPARFAFFGRLLAVAQEAAKERGQ